ncbi:MAG: carbohydrate ABC transporter permease [Bacillota bacterium]|jgi:multiple sugar transport system permease protein|nr:carbohydrate ABC transporter permease [Bacillota bacterium]HOB42910.1 carbohydrate ABC transporter permease [Bacillota bacterium]HOL50634.1 carbohydrate ABC transporter permease [Bacillota bacterium]HPZ13848.1 carbohydrate ABC transporter permease [Bacillota bacterium]HQD80524.1 carbohydrate ABC transporter permease [Bacillota bacterium]
MNRLRKMPMKNFWTYFILVLLGSTMIVPFIAMVSQSLKPGSQVLEYPFRWIPENPSMENYRMLFKQNPIMRWTLNSFIVAGGSTILQLITCSLAAYAFARTSFPGKDILFWMMMSMLIIPSQTTLVPLFLLFSKLNLTNTYTALLLPTASSAFGIFLLKQFMEPIPKDYDEAASLDGCTRFQFYSKILLPMCKPALAVLATFNFVTQWNDFLYPLIMTQTRDMFTLQIGLSALQASGSRGEMGGMGVVMAGAVWGFIPTFILFLLLQKYLVEGVSSAGIKG